ncbi:zinc finger HIT domain-containing protein [Haloferax mucosum]|nr:zinc finger HIT domain-containing protein [Haloferax mucosum]
MSIQGLCQVCEAASAEYRCRQCGSLVCDTHYRDDAGLCTTCATGL